MFVMCGIVNLKQMSVFLIFFSSNIAIHVLQMLIKAKHVIVFISNKTCIGYFKSIIPL